MESAAPDNREATDAWSGPLFERFVEYRELVTEGLGAHGEKALASHPPPPGASALDLGCGFGDTTQRIADLVGPEGEAVGVDVSVPFVEQARREAEGGPENVSFAVADVQVDDLGERLRLRLLADGHDVLRQPRGGAPQRALGAGARAGASARSSGVARRTTNG